MARPRAEGSGAQQVIQCPKCEKTFKRRCDLRQHEETHNPEKPYMCKQCPEKYGADRSRLRHIQRVHLPTQPHSCRHEDCGRTFSRKYLIMEHERQHHGGLHPKDYGDDPKGEEFTLQEIKGTDSAITLRNGKVLAPLHRNERTNLQKRFVRILFEDQSLNLSFFPFWGTGYLDPDWDSFVSCLEVRGFPHDFLFWALVTPSRPVHDSRSFGMALRRLIHKPDDYTETWKFLPISLYDTSFRGDEDSTASLPLSSTTPYFTTSTSSSSSLKRKSSDNEDDESESSGGSSKRVKSQTSSLRMPYGGFSTSKRANPNPLGLRTDTELAASYFSGSGPGGLQPDPAEAGGSVDLTSAPQNGDSGIAVDETNGLEFEPIGSQGSPEQFGAEFGAGFIFQEPSQDDELGRDIRDWLLDNQSA